MRTINQGAAQPNLNTDIIKRILVPFAPLAEQQEIVQKIDSYFKLAKAIEEYTSNCQNQMTKFNQSILAKAFRGELVPQDPNDEPASVLLERIKAERAASEETTKSKKPKPKQSATQSATQEKQPKVETTVKVEQTNLTTPSKQEEENGREMVQMSLFE